MTLLSKIVSVSKDISQISSDFLLDVFYPKFCVGCGEYGQYVCFDCVKEIEIIKTSICPDCGKISQLGKFCGNCKQKLDTKLSGIIVAANYEAGPTREMIHHLKYSGFLEIADMLGELIIQRLKIEKLPHYTIIVPVPLHKEKLAERGFNQSNLLALYISRKAKIPLSNALVRSRKTESQVKLSGDERRSNLDGAFLCIDKASIADKNILLVDDVTTTYSTLNECAKELLSSGAKRVYSLVVAKG